MPHESCKRAVHPGHASCKAGPGLGSCETPRTQGASQLSFQDGAGISFGPNGSTITAQFNQQIGLISHVGGNSVANVSRLAFSNASNVTFSLSTAAQAATLFASVAAGGGLTNINVSAGTASNNLSAITFSNLNNFSWGLNGSTNTAQSFMLVSGQNTAIAAISENVTRIQIAVDGGGGVATDAVPGSLSLRLAAAFKCLAPSMTATTLPTRRAEPTRLVLRSSQRLSVRISRPLATFDRDWLSVVAGLVSAQAGRGTLSVCER